MRGRSASSPMNMRSRDDGVGLAQALEAEHFAREDEAVARHELLNEPFLHLAEHSPRGQQR
jgi:hypothetical protein